MKFRTAVQGDPGLNATDLVVPDDVVAVLGRRATVVVTVIGYSCRATVTVMGGVAKLSLALVHRMAAVVDAGRRSRWWRTLQRARLRCICQAATAPRSPMP